jgi:hypothetical protein
MHPRVIVDAALELAMSGTAVSDIGARLGVPRRTVADWINGAIPHSASLEPGSQPDGLRHRAALGREYVHLLGLYLGDGCLSRQPRDVYKLRIFLDAKYPAIIAGAGNAIEAVADRKCGMLLRGGTCVEVYSGWRAWPSLFPQHGAGKKHERLIELAPWQVDLVARWPHELVKGLLQSDGCRFQNSGRGGWSAPRYAFKNRSTDIHRIFRDACERVGVRWTAAGVDTTYVSRQADVAILDEFIGPKR